MTLANEKINTTLNIDDWQTQEIPLTSCHLLFGIRP